MRIALTGTPGCGKTTLGALAAQRFGWRVVPLGAWAKEEGCVVAHDEEDGADVVDVRRLARRVPADDGSVVLYDGHLSHLLPLDGAWVLRCHPEELGRRLGSRGYPAGKVRENQEAEALDIILQEALQHQPFVRQRDATKRSPDALLAAFVAEPNVISNATDLEGVDWSNWLL
jgi:adenylate kinase